MAWGATKRPGPACISSGARWCGRAGIDWEARWRWTKRMWAASTLEEAGRHLGNKALVVMAA